MPSHLAQIHSNLPLQYELSPEKMLWEHTMYPLYISFSKPTLANRLAEVMIHGGGVETAGMISPVRASLIPDYLRFCPTCLREEACRGDAYWHRSHQINGVKVCHKHDQQLLDSTIAAKFTSSKKRYFPLTVSTEMRQNQEILDKAYADEYLQLSKMSYQILNTRLDPIEGVEEERRYRHYLRELGFIRKKNLLIQDLESAMKERFGSQLFNEIFNDFKSFFYNIRKNYVAHPVKHALLLTFIGVEPSKFLNTLVGDYCGPFGKGPWPCLNPFSDHYKQLVIPKVQINYGGAEPVGTFVCECGFAYIRRGMDGCDENIYEKVRIKEFGETFDNELLRRINEERRSFSGLAKEKGLTPSTVYNRYNKLLSTVTKTPHDNANFNKALIKEKHRTTILELIRSQKEITRSAITKTAPGAVVWLRKHDSVWLCSHLPAPKTVRHYERKQLNGDTDIMLAKKVIHAISTLRDDPLGPVRITKAAIERIVKVRLSNGQEMSRLPITRQVLAWAVESTNQFRFRKILWQIGKSNTHKLTVPGIMRELCISCREVELQNAISQLLSKTK